MPHTGHTTAAELRLILGAAYNERHWQTKVHSDEETQVTKVIKANSKSELKVSKNIYTGKEKPREHDSDPQIFRKQQ